MSLTKAHVPRYQSRTFEDARTEKPGQYQAMRHWLHCSYEEFLKHFNQWYPDHWKGEQNDIGTTEKPLRQTVHTNHL